MMAYLNSLKVKMKANGRNNLIDSIQQEKKVHKTVDVGGVYTSSDSENQDIKFQSAKRDIEKLKDELKKYDIHPDKAE